MALTFDGKVYSWGDGNEGKLGHGNRADCLTPRLIEVMYKSSDTLYSEFRLIRTKHFVPSDKIQ